MAFNASRLFNSSNEDVTSYLDNITLPAHKRDELLQARKDLRDALREAAGIVVEKLFQGAPRIRPRFVTQGSVSYGTLNAPCHEPQQADLDDGMYFPLSYVQQSGTPSVAAERLFSAVTACLEQVAKAKGWMVDETNPRCNRVIVAADMHIDLPMYSIPDSEFSRIVEARARELSVEFGSRISLTEADEDDDWSFVESNRVLLATRNEGWLAKDPRPIKVWVESSVDKKGEQLRRVMRYLKAWRDYQVWEHGDPKSILLMVAAEKGLVEAIHARDDLALKATARAMAQILSGNLPAPWDTSEDLASRLDEHPKLRADVTARLTQLANRVEDALDRSQTAAACCATLRQLFGDRLPNNPSAVLMASVAAEPLLRTASGGIVGRVQSA